MNSLKTAVMVVFLAAVAYVVYVSITKNPRHSDDASASSAWPESTKAELLGPGGQNTSAETRSSGLTGFGSLPFGMGNRPSTPANSTAENTTPASSASGVLPSDPHVIAPPNRDPARTAPLTSIPPLGAPSSPAIAGTNAATTLPLPSSLATPRAAETLPTGYTPAPAEGPIGASVTSPKPLDAAMLAQYNVFLSSVRGKLDEGKLDECLLNLSPLYGMPEIPPEQSNEITKLLGQLSGTVIYSRGHYLAAAYQAQPGETLAQIAQRCNVPAELLQRINGVSDPSALQPGQELKVLPGPFAAQISLSRHELVLKLQGRYAGRFPIGIGRDNPQLEGHYTVLEKILGPRYVGPDGATVEGNDPSNPFGRLAIDLGGVAIHGTNNLKSVGHDDNRGYICLGEPDIDDVFNILSVGSQVDIVR